MTHPTTRLLFVYGTLRRGQCSHDQLRGARYLGEARSEARYELLDMGEYPAMVAHGHTEIVGELYEVSEDLLVALDAFEDVPELYERTRLRVGAQEVECYVMPQALAQAAPRIASGDWCQR